MGRMILFVFGVRRGGRLCMDMNYRSEEILNIT